MNVDFDGDGDFSESFEDVSGYVDPVRSQVLVERGKDQLRSLAPPMAGKLDCVLTNSTEQFNNYTGPLAGMIEPGKKVQVQLPGSLASLTTEGGDILTTEGGDELTVEEGTVTIPFATGRTEDFEDNPDYGDEVVVVRCFGNLGFLIGRFGSSPVLQNVRTDEAINQLLDDAGWSADERVIQEGLTTFSWWWWPENQDAFTALKEIFFSEGPGASLYEDPQGRIVFENRYSRLTQARSTTSQITLTASDYIGRGARHNPRRKDVINQAAFTIRERAAQTESTIWEVAEPFTLAPGEVRKFKVKTSDGSPFIDAVAPTTSDGQSEVQVLTANADALAATGTIQLSFAGETTSAGGKSGAQSYAVSISSDAVDIQTAMQQLSTVGPGNLTVSGLLSTGLLFTFTGGLANMPVDLIGVSANLTGSGTPQLTMYRSVVGRKHGVVLTSGSIASSTLSDTSGEYVTLTITAGSSGATIDSVRVRAKAVTVTKEYQISNTVDASTSITKYGAKSYPYSVRSEIDPNTAQSLVDMIVYLYKDPRPMITIPIAPTDETIQAYQIAVEISDRVSVVLPQTGINDPYFIEFLRHSLDQFGISTELGLEKAWSDEFASSFAIVGSWELGTHGLAY